MKDLSSLWRFAAVLALALALAAPGAVAQGKGSPPGGPPKGPPATTPPENSDRGNVPPNRQGQAPGNNNRSGGNKSMVGAEALAVSLAAPAAQVGGALRAGTLVAPSGVGISREAQAVVLQLISGSGANGALVAALTAPANHGAHVQAEALSRSMTGLLATPAERLRPAAEAYNAFVDASSAEFLRAPPAEFLAVQAVLQPMVQQAIAASK